MCSLQAFVEKHFREGFGLEQIAQVWLVVPSHRMLPDSGRRIRSKRSGSMMAAAFNLRCLPSYTLEVSLPSWLPHFRSVTIKSVNRQVLRLPPRKE